MNLKKNSHESIFFTLFNFSYNNTFVFQLYNGGQFYWCMKTTAMPQVADKLYTIMLYRVHLDMSVLRTYKVSSDRH